jgi:hypothetical protein
MGKGKAFCPKNKIDEKVKILLRGITTMLTTSEYQANEKYFLQMMKSKLKFYMWKDKGNCYDLSSGKMKPLTLKGYVDLLEIVRKPFMKLFVILPEDHDYDKVWEVIDSITE